MIYVQIKDTSVVNVFEWAEDRPPVIEGLLHIDVADLPERPQVGDVYDEATGQFNRPVATEASEIFLHVVLSGGDGRSDPIGLLNDGGVTDRGRIHIAAVLRTGLDAEASVIPHTDSFRVIIRDSDSREYEVVEIPMADGVVDTDYSTAGRGASCHIDDTDFTPIAAGGGTYKVRLAQAVSWKVYRML